MFGDKERSPSSSSSNLLGSTLSVPFQQECIDPKVSLEIKYEIQPQT
jgi:hypothetical protein